MTLDDQSFSVESIHRMEGSLIPLELPLGYYFSIGDKVVAAVQVNGQITLQSDEVRMDTYVIATVASDLSFKPESD